jgi:hypothetical protein
MLIVVNTQLIRSFKPMATGSPGLYVGDVIDGLLNNDNLDVDVVQRREGNGDEVADRGCCEADGVASEVMSRVVSRSETEPGWMPETAGWAHRGRRARRTGWSDEIAQRWSQRDQCQQNQRDTRPLSEGRKLQEIIGIKSVIPYFSQHITHLCKPLGLDPVHKLPQPRASP